MPEQVRILAGDCTVTDEDADGTRRERGNVLVITYLDNCRELLVDHSPKASATNRHRFARAKRLSVVPTKARA
jgi:hypothetical protein